MMFLPLPRRFLSLGVGPATRCPKDSLALTPGAGRFHSVWLALMGSRAAAGCAPIWGWPTPPLRRRIQPGCGGPRGAFPAFLTPKDCTA